jgi:hypothetical protein
MPEERNDAEIEDSWDSGDRLVLFIQKKQG